MGKRYTDEEALARYLDAPDFVEGIQAHSERVRIPVRKLLGLRFTLRYVLAFGQNYGYLKDVWGALYDDTSRCPSYFGMTECDLRVLLAVRLSHEHDALVPCIYNLSSRRPEIDSDEPLPPSPIERRLASILADLSQLKTLDRAARLRSPFDPWARAGAVIAALEAPTPEARQRAELYLDILTQLSYLEKDVVQLQDEVDTNTDAGQVISQALALLDGVFDDDDRQLVKRALGKVYSAGRDAGKRDVYEEVYRILPRSLVGYDLSPQQYAVAYGENIGALQDAFTYWQSQTDKFKAEIYAKDASKTPAPLLSRLLIRSPEERETYYQDGTLPEVDHSVFEERVREFFDPHTEWAERYIAYYYSDTTPREAQQAELFPEGMLYYIHDHLFRKADVVALRDLVVLD